MVDSIMPTVSIITLGCAKNEVDSKEMGDRLHRVGYRVNDDPKEADVIIVNTCSFIQPATEESIDAIFEVAGLDNVTCGDAHIVVAGCMPARYGDDLADELQEVDAFVPCSKEDDIVEIVGAFFTQNHLNMTKGFTAEEADGASEADGARNPAAYVKISDGCDRWCSYCTIPLIRGDYHSFAFDDIIADTEARIAEGACEITLIAQDTGRWGQDFAVPSTLAELMTKLAERFPDTWFRVMYIQPEGITDELLAAMAAHANICSYLDIPVQHASADILRAMNRRGSGGQFLTLIEHIRKVVPGVTLRTTVIAGFPGETDEQIDELGEFLQQAQFDYVGVFPYSREDGTKAALLEGQIDEEMKLERAQEIRDIADAVSVSRIKQRIGEQMDVLVLGVEDDDQLFGRAQCQAPDVDGVVFLERGDIGDIVSVTIDDTLMYEMEGA